MLFEKERESCDLMVPFGKYILFGTQLYEIWKPAFNVENYIFFLHSELAAYFVPILPFFFSFRTHHPPFPPSQWNRLTLCRYHHRLPLTPLSDRQSPPFSLSLSSFSLFPDGINANNAQPDFIPSCENLIGIN